MMLVLVTKWCFLPACNGMIHITVGTSPELSGKSQQKHSIVLICFDIQSQCFGWSSEYIE